MTRQQVVDDDGSSWTSFYDTTGDAPWSVYERTWDANGNQILDWVTRYAPIEL